MFDRIFLFKNELQLLRPKPGLRLVWTNLQRQNWKNIRTIYNVFPQEKFVCIKYSLVNLFFYNYFSYSINYRSYTSSRYTAKNRKKVMSQSYINNIEKRLVNNWSHYFKNVILISIFINCINLIPFTQPFMFH